MSDFTNVITYLSCVSVTSTIKSKFGASDFLASRIKRVASTTQTLSEFCEKILSVMNSELAKIPQEVFASVVKLQQKKEEAAKVLAFLRDNSSTCAMLAVLPKEERKEICDTIELPEVTASTFVAPPRRPFDIPVTFVCESPLSHGAESNPGNAMLFRRQVVAPGVALPFYSGNAVRGLLRDILAAHFVDTVLSPDYLLETWFFHTMFEGGALSEQSKAQKALAKEFGTVGVTKGEGLRRFRDTLPMVSLFGCALGNRILSGRVNVGDFRPRCKEWGTGDEPAQNLFSWEFLTRRDDNEDRSPEEEHAGMIAETECLKVGTILDGGIDLSAHISALEKGALMYALGALDTGYLGGQNRRGFGRVKVECESLPEAAEYLVYLQDNKSAIIEYLLNLGAIAKA